jgi:hypothetical protein
MGIFEVDENNFFGASFSPFMKLINALGESLLV